MEAYETIYLLRSDLTEEGVKKINDKVAEILSRRGGKMVAQKDLGMKPLAYRIERQTRGRFYQLNFEGDGPVIDDLEKNLRLSEECLRFLTVRMRTPRTKGHA